MTGRAAPITGGDSGIGRAVAIAFAREGADAAISFLANEEEDATETARWVEASGRKALLPGDITDPAWCKSRVEKTCSEFGRLDVPVNNAAFQKTHEDIGDPTPPGGTATHLRHEHLRHVLPRAGGTGQDEAGQHDHQHVERAG